MSQDGWKEVGRLSARRPLSHTNPLGSSGWMAAGTVDSCEMKRVGEFSERPRMLLPNGSWSRGDYRVQNTTQANARYRSVSLHLYLYAVVPVNALHPLAGVGPGLSRPKEEALGVNNWRNHNRIMSAEIPKHPVSGLITG
ncbi:hypothetical protein EYF80_010552 [Liparis tanakae]|uniref:Uncharacterized protein n=1 Tax=Liparis tanakae TaxID=230148 RepID=A0A4Z2INF8_9TELE|nr:hypothetical protein EYF80_010552 [Liparis tanakae]